MIGRGVCVCASKEAATVGEDGLYLGLEKKYPKNDMRTMDMLS